MSLILTDHYFKTTQTTHLFVCQEELNMNKMRHCGYRFSLKPPAVVLKCKPDQNQYKPWGLIYVLNEPTCFKRALFFFF